MKCTKCGKGEGIYPYPKKQMLCTECFFPTLEKGLNRLNKVLAGKTKPYEPLK